MVLANNPASSFFDDTRKLVNQQKDQNHSIGIAIAYCLLDCLAVIDTKSVMLVWLGGGGGGNIIFRVADIIFRTVGTYLSRSRHIFRVADIIFRVADIISRLMSCCCLANMGREPRGQGPY